MYALFTDTDTDITLDVAKHYGYNLISMPYTIDDKDVYPYKDFEVFESHQFYDQLRKGVMPKTSGLSPVQYEEYFEPFFAKGQDILYVHFSAAMSGTFSAMNLAVESLKKKYPDRKLYTIDTKGITICSYAIVREVGDMYLAGKSIFEILQWAKTEVDKYAVYFFAEDLKFFARSGRVKSFKAFMGNMLGIRPILTMGSDGMMASVDTARGKKATLNKIMQYVHTLASDIDKHRVIIGHADCLPVAEELAAELQREFGDNLNIEFVQVNPTAGSHCGPDTVGVCFHAIHR